MITGYCRHQSVGHNWKIRNHFCIDVVVADGDPDYAFVHVGLLIREGRPIETQKEATQRVMKVLKETFGHLFETRRLSLTVDLKEMRDGIALTEHNITTK